MKKGRFFRLHKGMIAGFVWLVLALLVVTHPTSLWLWVCILGFSPVAYSLFEKSEKAEQKSRR